MHSLVRFFVYFFAATLLLAVPALAQLETGNITGRVTDSTGAVMVKARVTLVNLGTNLKIEQETNSDGIFNVPALQPGSYQVTAQYKGFEQSTMIIELSVGDTAHADIVLQVGSDSTTVTVESGGAYQLETQNVASDFVVTKQEVIDLPLNGGNPYALAALSPGVVPLGSFGQGLVAVRGAAQTAGNANFSVNGGTPGSNEILLDGVPITVCCQGQPALTPTTAIVEQLRIVSSVPPAQYGRSSGGVLNYGTFSGTNALHGQVYEFFENTKLHAAQYFVKRDQYPVSLSNPGDYRMPLHYNQYGAGLGGPVVLPHLYNGKDKTFYFLGYGGVDASVGSYNKLTVPSLKMRQGDFSESCLTKAGAPDPTCTAANDNTATLIYNPATVVCNSTSGICTRSAFPGNVIPNIGSVASAYLNFIPLPNTVGTPDYALYPNASGTIDNFNSLTTTRRTDRQFSVRLDHEFSPRQRLLVRTTYTYNHNHIPDESNNFNGPNASHQNIAAIVGALQDTWMLSNRSVLTLQYGFAFQSNNLLPGNFYYSAADGGFNPYFAGEQPISALPALTITDQDSIGSTGMFHDDKYTHSFGAQLTTQLGKHTLVGGIDFREMILNNGDRSNPVGTFGYSGTYSYGPTADSEIASYMAHYSSFADFLQGNPNSGSIDVNRSFSDVQQYGALFLQDNWRTSAKLTLNLGLRYDVESGPIAKHNYYATFDPNIPDPAVSAIVGFPVTGGLSFRGTGGHSAHFFNTYWNQFSPRIGLAYAFDKDTVFRAAFGVMNLPTSQRLYGSYNSAEEVITNFVANRIVPNVGTYVYPIGIGNPYPTGLNPLPLPSQGSAADLGTDVGGLVYQTPFSYVEQWHADLQQSLGQNLTFTLGYSGSHGVKLPIEFGANDLLPKMFSTTVSKLNTYVSNPFYGQVQAGPYASATIPYYYLVSRYPQFSGVKEDFVGQGSASYNSLQAVLRKRWRNGSNLSITYVWSKSLGDVDDLTTGYLDTGTPGWQNSYFPQGIPGQPGTGNRSYSTVDVPQRVIASMIARIPYGHGQAFGRTIPEWQQALLGNWQVNMVAAAQTGYPLNIGETEQGQYGGSRPLIVPGQNFKTGGSITQRLGGVYSTNGYFNPNAFKLTGAFQFGNMPRLCALCRAPGVQNIDASVFKIVSLNHTFTMQFRVEMYNVLNYVQFGTPNTTYNGTTFGDITSQANIPRTIQLAARIIW